MTKKVRQVVINNATDVEIVTDRNYTMVRIEYLGRQAVGFAKRNPTDKYDRARGIQIARGRACAKLASGWVNYDREWAEKALSVVVSV